MTGIASNTRFHFCSPALCPAQVLMYVLEAKFRTIRRDPGNKNGLSCKCQIAPLEANFYQPSSTL